MLVMEKDWIWSGNTRTSPEINVCHNREPLELGLAYLTGKLNEGMPVMSVNCYPPFPQHSLGIPRLSDYSCLINIPPRFTRPANPRIGDHGSWRAVPVIHGPSRSMLVTISRFNTRVWCTGSRFEARRR